FHDGTPLDAEAVALNLQERKDGALTGSAHGPMESVEATDDRTVVVTMNTPWSGFDHVVATFTGYMIAPAALGDGDRTRVIGTGPFVFDRWEPDTSLTVLRNDDYWGEPAHLDGIEFRFLPDVLTRQAALDTGDIDAAMTPEPTT